MASLAASLSGFALGGSLIVAIGAQNAFILRMGLLRRFVFALCLTCALADALLIVAGVAGTGALVKAFPIVLDGLSAAGAAFLFAYAILSARRALRPESLAAANSAPSDFATAMATCLAFTFLNPHVYLDTMVLVGSLSSAHEGAARIAFAAGAVAASFVWFFGLGYGAALLAPVFARPVAWRILDTVIAITMAGLGSSLLLRLFA